MQTEVFVMLCDVTTALPSTLTWWLEDGGFIQTSNILGGHRKQVDSDAGAPRL